ncbi:hypothetical protein GCM10018781_37680 [Kitasatospora indigofera]|uniref:Uncharacterized protein n=1 Tax=Kitasatospora indigofera TaxID=67307 RepID=A0A919FVM3_9ACTN|nr:hypothetical protein GCM10018781_37680 [Kitasatospora indigofera]
MSGRNAASRAVAVRSGLVRTVLVAAAVVVRAGLGGTAVGTAVLLARGWQRSVDRRAVGGQAAGRAGGATRKDGAG